MMKSPPIQYDDHTAKAMVAEFIEKYKFENK